MGAFVSGARGAIAQGAVDRNPRTTVHVQASSFETYCPLHVTSTPIASDRQQDVNSMHTACNRCTRNRKESKLIIL